MSKILVVDDESSIRLTLKNCPRKGGSDHRGHRVGNSGEAAREELTLWCWISN
jgi:CheY-like chemotaxis protein